MPALGGSAAPGFERVTETFSDNFGPDGDVGAAVAVYSGGRSIVNLWGGDARPGQPWRHDTLVSVFSTTKGPAALAIQLLVDRGALEIEAPVARYWPEFGANGKEAVTLRHVLTHTSGVITIPGYLERIDDDDVWNQERIANDLAQAPPLWEPGTGHGYHALTLGWICAELVRRVTGLTIGTFFRKEIAAPLGLDFWIGLPKEHHRRAADLIDAPPPTHPQVAAFLSLFTPDTWTGQAHFVGPDGVDKVADTFNEAETRSAEIPSGGGIGTAESLARMYAMLAGGGELEGVRLLSKESVDLFATETVRGPDNVLILESRFGLGYSLSTRLAPYGPNDASFGHGGLGGSVAFADPVANLSFAYTPNQLRFQRPDTKSRAQRLIDAVYSCL